MGIATPVRAAIQALGSGFTEADPAIAHLVNQPEGPRRLRDYLARLTVRLMVLLIAEHNDLLHPPGTDTDVRCRYHDECAPGICGRHWPTVNRVLHALGSSGAPGWGLGRLGGVFTPIPGELPPPSALDSGALDQALLHLSGLIDIARCDLGSVYEATFDVELRNDDGNLTVRRSRRPTGTSSWYTPQDVVDLIVDETFTPLSAGADPGTLTVCDPACGGGRFLVAWANRLAAHLTEVTGNPPEDEIGPVISNLVYGVDIDPTAVGVTRSALWLLSGQPGTPPPAIERHIRIGDALLGAPAPVTTTQAADAWCAEFFSPGPAPHQFFHWHLEFPEIMADGGFAAVIGNPPFLSALRRTSSRSAPVRALLSQAMPGISRAYTDLSALFVILAVKLTRPGGAVGLVQPLSVLSAQDAAEVRRTVTERCCLSSMWFSTEPVFAADVATCVIVLRPDMEQGDMRVFTGPKFARSADQPWPAGVTTDWGMLAARAHGVPISCLDTNLRLGSTCRASAGFRDQFYGLRSMIVEDAPDQDVSKFPRLITTKLIDPAHPRWGEAPTRFDGMTWRAPRIDLDRLAEDRPAIAAWVTRQQVPKVLVAPQSRVIEAVVDVDGTWVGSVPVVAVVPEDPAMVWQLAAALTAPSLSAHAAARYLGTGLNSAAIRLGASQILDLPAPIPSDALTEAGEVWRTAQETTDPVARRTALLAAANLADQAYQADSAAWDWWVRSLPGA